VKSRAAFPALRGSALAAAFAGSSEDCSLLFGRLQQHPGIPRITLQPGASRNLEGGIVMVD
jgi:hypothetical protein